jgi:hypothetical protein
VTLGKATGAMVGAADAMGQSGVGNAITYLQYSQ